MKKLILPFISAAMVAGVANWAVGAPDDPASQAAKEVQTAEIAKALADASIIPAGQRSFVKCQACHMVGENAQPRVGPPLNGVVGRAAGTAEKFRYSPAMQKAATDGFVWTMEKLDAYLAAPRAVVPGTTMGFVGIPKPEERKALIAYLASFSADGARIDGSAE